MDTQNKICFYKIGFTTITLRFTRNDVEEEHVFDRLATVGQVMDKIPKSLFHSREPNSWDYIFRRCAPLKSKSLRNQIVLEINLQHSTSDCIGDSIVHCGRG
jgi:hypothetical protein